MSIATFFYKLAAIIFLATAVITAMNLAKGGMATEEAVASLGIEVVHEQLIQQGEHTSRIAKYCKGKLGIADKSFKLLREEGWTIDQAIGDLRSSRKILAEHGQKIEQFRYLEYERMARTIDRHPELSEKSLREQFYGECLSLGF